MNDHSGALLEAHWQERPGQSDGWEQVQPERPMPFTIIEDCEPARRRGRSAYYVDNDIDASESDANRVCHRCAPFGRRDIGRDKGLDLDEIAGCCPGRGEHRRPHLTQPGNNRLADPLGAAGHERAATIQFASSAHERMSSSAPSANHQTDDPLAIECEFIGNVHRTTWKRPSD